MNNLQFYYKELRKEYDSVKSIWCVNRYGREFKGFEVEIFPLLVDVEMERIKEIVGLDYSVRYLPNQEVIFIQ